MAVGDEIGGGAGREVIGRARIGGGGAEPGFPGNTRALLPGGRLIGDSPLSPIDYENHMAAVRATAGAAWSRDEAA